MHENNNDTVEKANPQGQTQEFKRPKTVSSAGGNAGH
jgi:hypothetical protein